MNETPDDGVLILFYKNGLPKFESMPTARVDSPGISFVTTEKIQFDVIFSSIYLLSRKLYLDQLSSLVY